MVSHSSKIHRIWVIDAHPQSASLGSALAARYAEGARQAGHEVRLTVLRDLCFDYNTPQAALEPDLVTAQEALQWCRHVTVVYPNWWGTYPALFKAFLDRILLPGFAFQVEEKGWKGLLSGRSAQIITTMDTPFWVYRWILGAPGIRAMVRATFGFCGIKPVQVKLFGPVHGSTPAQRQEWLGEVLRMGLAADQAIRPPRADSIKAWLAAARLQFYPFPLLVLATGALAGAASLAQPLQSVPLLLAAGCAFLMELFTVLTNELHDQETDRLNRNAGLFTGGSRVLVDRRLTAPQLESARLLTAGFLLVLASALAYSVPSHALSFVGLVLVGGLLGHQYSAGPLRLSYRSWGELNVAFTHSFLVAALGWVSQGGPMNAAFPWGFTTAIFVSVLPSIILAGVPDRDADRAAGKNTLVVRWGVRRASFIAMTAAGAAMILKSVTSSGGPLSPWLTGAAIVHGLVLLGGLGLLSRRSNPDKINGLLVLALSFMVWFALEPFLAYAGMIP
jgi:1,4-dihydroxy-2-naphthoate octaprenyltransferase